MDLFDSPSVIGVFPCIGRASIHGFVQLKAREILEKSDQVEGGFVVRKLLTETDSGPCIERAEDVRVREEVFAMPFVKESVRVEF